MSPKHLPSLSVPKSGRDNSDKSGMMKTASRVLTDGGRGEDEDLQRALDNTDQS